MLISGPATARINLDGRDLINFAGCSYLALSRQAALVEAARSALSGAFSMQVPTAYGVRDSAFEEAESSAAGFWGTEAAVYVPCGYTASMVAVVGFSQGCTHAFVDEFAHPCLFDGAKIAGLTVHRFRHLDPNDLANTLAARSRAGMKALVLCDGVVASTGVLAPLRDYVAISQKWELKIVVDDAHGFGTVGPSGRGVAEELGVSAMVHSVGTLGKAFCAQGGIIPCARLDYHRLKSLPMVRGSASGSPVSAAVSAEALRLVQRDASYLCKLQVNARLLRKGLQALGYSVPESPAPIVAFECGDKARMAELQRFLLTRGIFVLHSSYFGVADSGVIRCAAFADHSQTDVDMLVEEVRSFDC